MPDLFFLPLRLLLQQEAIGMAIDAMLAYPNDTNFFINSWTWGYEELLQQIIVIFDSVVSFQLFRDTGSMNHGEVCFADLVINIWK
jgi:hypothetical protein